MSFVTGPIAPENNPPIEPQNFQPSNYTISSLTLGMQTTVTLQPTLSAPAVNNFVIGQQVRFNIAGPYGTQQLDQMTGYVLSIPNPNQVVVGIDSRHFTPFRSAPLYRTPPQITAIGDVNSGPINQTRSNEQTFINGSFINISPVFSG